MGDSSQEINDLEKCLWHLKQVEEGPQQFRFDTICIYGGLGGRFDQTMSSVSAHFKFLDVFENVILIDEETTATLLKPCEGDSTHVIRPATAVEGKLCGRRHPKSFRVEFPGHWRLTKKLLFVEL